MDRSIRPVGDELLEATGDTPCRGSCLVTATLAFRLRKGREAWKSDSEAHYPQHCEIYEGFKRFDGSLPKSSGKQVRKRVWKNVKGEKDVILRLMYGDPEKDFVLERVFDKGWIVIRPKQKHDCDKYIVQSLQIDRVPFLNFWLKSSFNPLFIYLKYDYKPGELRPSDSMLDAILRLLWSRSSTRQHRQLALENSQVL